MALAALLLLGCQKVELGILVNASGEPIRVTYSVARFRAEEGGPLTCRPNDYPVSVRRTPRNHRWAARDWVSSTTARLDTERCTITLVLDPGFSALLSTSQFCGDHEALLAVRPNMQPYQTLLRIETPGRTFEWRGWDTVKPFKRNRDDDCIFVFE
jgi:hypothetical protein